MSKQNIVAALLDLPLAELLNQSDAAGWVFGVTRCGGDRIAFTLTKKRPEPRQTTIDDPDGKAPADDKT